MLTLAGFTARRSTRHARSGRLASRARTPTDSDGALPRVPKTSCAIASAAPERSAPRRLEDVIHRDQKLYLVFEFLDLDLKKHMDANPHLCQDHRLVKVPPPPPP